MAAGTSNVAAWDLPDIKSGGFIASNDNVGDNIFTERVKLLSIPHANLHCVAVGAIKQRRPIRRVGGVAFSVRMSLQLKCYVLILSSLYLYSASTESQIIFV